MSEMPLHFDQVTMVTEEAGKAAGLLDLPGYAKNEEAAVSGQKSADRRGGLAARRNTPAPADCQRRLIMLPPRRIHALPSKRHHIVGLGKQARNRPCVLRRMISRPWRQN